MNLVKKIEKEFPTLSTAAMMIAVLSILFLYKTFFQVYWVPSGSMIPTLSLGEIVISKNIHTPSDVERGDIISFDYETGDIFIKRLIGMPGDTIEIKDGTLYLNDEPQDEQYLNEGRNMASFEKITVPEGHYFMMGDNRNFSSDSRVFGPVAFEKFRSKAIFHYPSILRALLSQ